MSTIVDHFDLIELILKRFTTADLIEFDLYQIFALVFIFFNIYGQNLFNILHTAWLYKKLISKAL